jgi:hypothetical protein
MPLLELGRRLREETPQGRLSKRKISLKNISNVRDSTHAFARRIKNLRIQFAKKHIEISINKLRDKSRLYLNLSTRTISF